MRCCVLPYFGVCEKIWRAVYFQLTPIIFLFWWRGGDGHGGRGHGTSQKQPLFLLSAYRAYVVYSSSRKKYCTQTDIGTLVDPCSRRRLLSIQGPGVNIIQYSGNVFDGIVCCSRVLWKRVFFRFWRPSNCGVSF